MYEADSVDLSSQNLTTIYTDSCYGSLEDTRSEIKSACPTPKNYTNSDGTSCPAMQRVDRLLDTYNKTCLRDR